MKYSYESIASINMQEIEKIQSLAAYPPSPPTDAAGTCTWIKKQNKKNVLSTVYEYHKIWAKSLAC